MITTQTIEIGDLVRVISGNHPDRHLSGEIGILRKKYGHGRCVAMIELFNENGYSQGRINVGINTIELVQKASALYQEQEELEEEKESFLEY